MGGGRESPGWIEPAIWSFLIKMRIRHFAVIEIYKLAHFYFVAAVASQPPRAGTGTGIVFTPLVSIVRDVVGRARKRIGGREFCHVGTIVLLG